VFLTLLLFTQYYFIINIIYSIASFFFKERERQKVKDAKIREMALAQKQRMLQQQHVKSNAMFRR
jgi:hypothetical protein